MPGISAADALVLLARLAFVVLLYAFVFTALVSLRRAVRGAAHVARAPLPTALLTLTDAPSVDGPVGRSVSIDRALLIGRRPDCDVILHDDAVSGHHARIAWDSDGWQIEDLASTNGTLVNARRASGPVKLRDGDVIQVGNTRWALRA